MSAPAGKLNFDVGQESNSVAAQSQYMSFVIDGRTYAIPLSDVAEITPYVELNHMPHMPADVVGLLDLRGSVLPIISLRTRMGLPGKDSYVGDTILLLDTQQGSRIGILVDQVESVITAFEDQHAHLSPLLEGKSGKWVKAILLLNGKVVLVLEPAALIDTSQIEEGEKKKVAVQVNDIELQLDKGLRDLIALAGHKKNDTVIPQIRSVIGHNESEVTKVIEQVESMLSSTDNAFSGISRFRQEAAMCGIEAFNVNLSQLENIAQEVQNNIFDVINQLQFQDIVRQKLERVLRHIIGMQDVVSAGFNSNSTA
ncbi:MAG: chemotaxis protein CheW [Holophagaceae bacterium]|jgi:purine-binding chemotaxis protein CheW|nr:chemotaxis protein CheW [Holophagaceae bacterium]